MNCSPRSSDLLTICPHVEDLLIFLMTMQNALLRRYHRSFGKQIELVLIVDEAAFSPGGLSRSFPKCCCCGNSSRHAFRIRKRMMFLSYLRGRPGLAQSCGAKAVQLLTAAAVSFQLQRRMAAVIRSRGRKVS
jgi:hypothetical protein